MEFKHDCVIGLYLAGNVNKSFVSRIIARYRDTCSVATRPTEKKRQ